MASHWQDEVRIASVAGEVICVIHQLRGAAPDKLVMQVRSDSYIGQVAPSLCE